MTAINEPELVSIVTPSYQQGRFLRQCIDSVLTQDYPHIEYFVFDGGSKDESRSILESYGDRFYWQSEPDGGQTSAINAGLRRAKGSILAYLNSDDILLPGAVSTVVNEFRSKPETDLLYGRAHYIDADGKTIGDYDTREFSVETFKAQCYICQPAAFWRRGTMDRLGMFDEEFQTAMDYEFWQRIAAHGGRIEMLDAYLACSRDYETTKTRSQRDKVYRDVFKSQWLHWGGIHPQWWRGWIDHWKVERKGFWSPFIPGVKKTAWLSNALAKVVRKW
jgi:glycosyltransferase involved in cell wall biosynthesis